jgi:hypothetical protein
MILDNNQIIKIVKINGCQWIPTHFLNCVLYSEKAQNSALTFEKKYAVMKYYEFILKQHYKNIDGC